MLNIYIYVYIYFIKNNNGKVCWGPTSKFEIDQAAWKVNEGIKQ